MRAVNAFVAVVVRIDKQLGPAVRKGLRINSISMVLRSDVATTRELACARDVLSAVTILHFGRLSASSEG